MGWLTRAFMGLMEGSRGYSAMTVIPWRTGGVLGGAPTTFIDGQSYGKIEHRPFRLSLA